MSQILFNVKKILLACPRLNLRPCIALSANGMHVFNRYPYVCTNNAIPDVEIGPEIKIPSRHFCLVVEAKV